MVKSAGGLAARPSNNYSRGDTARSINMPVTTQRITPFLWFDNQAEEAVAFYTSIFKNSKVLTTARYTEEASQAAGRPAGSVMVIDFELDGQRLSALNGGPHFKFNEAISLVVHCQSQEEVDYYWDRLSKDGDPSAQQCGWLKDRFGLSWQVVPDRVTALLTDRDPEKGRRAMAAILTMKKIDVAEVERAATGAERPVAAKR
jgi:predicted 3-demethylubiquinone-9 3-methyltransferase (glyoxalase superfamily)